MMNEKMKAVPVPTKEDKKATYISDKAHVTWPPSHWKNVILSDQKHFNLDDPDEFAEYWHDLRT